MVRTLGGITAGMAGAIVIMMVAEAVVSQLSPVPSGIAIGTLTDPTPPSFLALVMPVVGWFLGAFVGAWLAIRISDRAQTAWAVAAAVIAATILNFVLIYYPPWVIVAGLVVPVLGAALARRVARRPNV